MAASRPQIAILREPDRGCLIRLAVRLMNLAERNPMFARPGAVSAAPPAGRRDAEVGAERAREHLG